MNLQQLLSAMEDEKEFTQRLTAWAKNPSRPARYEPLSVQLHPELERTIEQRGICNLYSHQVQAVEAALEGRNPVIATPTASGKSLGYILPILHHTLSEPSTRSLLLFPTKALAQDQRSNIQSWIDSLEADISTYTYDGDTPPNVRKNIRSAGHVVISNPDMLHTGILPHHTKWVRLFENLQYIVIDELHTYRGVFGSHVANVLRRLLRIARFYGSEPVLITCSATIANPRQLAERLTGRQFELIDQSGAPQGEKHVLLYNPPVVNKQLGIRQNSLISARSLVRRFLSNGLQTIVFARSRLQVEVLLSYLRHSVPSANIRGYRGGYLPGQRREIERGLRSGEIQGVVATNALELGIDIGSLQAAVLVGYPGTVASTWQQMGRVGRGEEVSAAFLVASSNALDQHIINHPEYFFSQSPESALINPDNLLILVNHLKCAAFELPFARGEKFGDQDIEEILIYLAEHRILHRSGDKWYWMAEGFPAEDISLRSASRENVVIVDTTEVEPSVIGEVDEFSAPMLVHEGAIYLHESQQYQVEKLDMEENKAFVRQVDVNFYTDASLAVEVGVLDVMREDASPTHQKYFGEVRLTAQPTKFKKVRFHTHENVGWGDIHLPPQEMHTSAYWVALQQSVVRHFGKSELESGLLGLANLLAEVSPLYLSCDRNDLYVINQVRSPFTERPTIYVCDAYPGGVGFGQKLYDVEDQVLQSCRDLVKSCECSHGCPSCVGAIKEVSHLAKEAASRLLHYLLQARAAD